MFYFDLYIINVYVILPPDLGPFAVNKYIHTYPNKQHKTRDPRYNAKILYVSLLLTTACLEVTDQNGS
jgi:hypothetical protein